MTRIGILGYGMVGKVWFDQINWRSLGLRPEVYDPASPDVPPAYKANSPGRLAEAETVLVFVGGAVAEEAVRSIFIDDRRGPKEILDFSSSGPSAKQQLAKWSAERGSSYIDVTILGAVSVTGSRTPLVLAGSALSETAQGLLESSGAPLSYIEGGAPGDAAQLKLVRSIVMKGLEALAVEARFVAEEVGILSAYEKVFADVDANGFSEILDAMIATHTDQRERRGAETREVIRMLQGLGRSSALVEAVAENYESGPFR